MLTQCPHCGTWVHIRTSRPVSVNIREAYVQCPNIECACTGKVLVTYMHDIAPSMRPNPKAYLPQGKARCAAQNERQLDLLPT